MNKTATRASIAIAALTLSLGLSACGGGESDAYCSAAKEEFGKFTEESMGDLTDTSNFGKFADAFSAVGKVAPEDIKSDYETVAKVMSTIADSGGDLTKLAGLEEDAKEMEPAAERIKTSLKDTCDYDSGFGK